jgi:hypothetical protein
MADGRGTIARGRDLEEYTEDQWQTLLDKPELVFARASPQVLSIAANAAHQVIWCCKSCASTATRDNKGGAPTLAYMYGSLR